MHPAPPLRPATRADHAFLFRLYASTRTDELAATGWSAAEREAFLRNQFAARTQSYEASFPHAEHRILLDGATPVGAFVVDRRPAEIRLVDLALLPAQRGRGRGTRVLRELMDEARATGRPLRLHALQGSAAERWYLRLGFAPTGVNGTYLALEWRG